jgi:Lrp/AsnC family transcriptional regulator for asnA, asnC and gidA
MPRIRCNIALRPQKAFVLIKTEPGREREVADKLAKLADVREVHIITGEWDILAVVETEREIVLPTDEKVLELVMDKITTLPYLRDTNTIIPSFSKYKQS